MKRITTLAHGSRGDVQPYVALGVGFKRTGYAVKVAASTQFQSLIEEYDLEFAPLAGDPRLLMAESVDKADSQVNFLRMQFESLKTIWRFEYVYP
jgi:sterol 3beta-glucosyltransferase